MRKNVLGRGRLLAGCLVLCLSAFAGWTTVRAEDEPAPPVKTIKMYAENWKWTPKTITVPGRNCTVPESFRFEVATNRRPPLTPLPDVSRVANATPDGVGAHGASTPSGSPFESSALSAGGSTQARVDAPVRSGLVPGAGSNGNRPGSTLAGTSTRRRGWSRCPTRRT